MRVGMFLDLAGVKAPAVADALDVAEPGLDQFSSLTEQRIGGDRLVVRHLANLLDF
jgi:hypothetical protein